MKSKFFQMNLFGGKTAVAPSYHHIKTWQLTTSADQLRTYKIDAK